MLTNLARAGWMVYVHRRCTLGDYLNPEVFRVFLILLQPNQLHIPSEKFYNKVTLRLKATPFFFQYSMCLILTLVVKPPAFLTEPMLALCSAKTLLLHLLMIFLLEFSCSGAHQIPFNAACNISLLTCPEQISPCPVLSPIHGSLAYCPACKFLILLSTALYDVAFLYSAAMRIIIQQASLP